MERKTVSQSFCTCHKLQCNCGEEYYIYEWTWDKDHLQNCNLMSANEREVLFDRNMGSIVGTVRGALPFQENRHYYWEIKVLTSLSAADVTVGIGTEDMALNELYIWFQAEGFYWGYSNCGYFRDNYIMLSYGPPFGKGSIIGVHLDTCNGTVEFYNNRRPLGVASDGLKGKRLYPMVWCGTAQAAVRLTCALSMTPSLQLLSLLTLRKNKMLASSIDRVPGLRNLLASRFWWLMGVEQTQQHKEKHAIVSSPSPSHETGPSRCIKNKWKLTESSSSDSDHDENQSIPSFGNSQFAI